MQERAYVTGLRAANLVIKQLGQGIPATILPTEADEPHVALGKAVNRRVKAAIQSFGLRSPLL